MTRSDATASPSGWHYAYWAFVGVVGGLGVVSLLTVGVVFLLLASALVAFGSLRPAMRNRSVGAVVAGLAVPVLFLAWLNRYGPGEHCVYSDGGSSSECSELWSPWPFVAVAAICVIASFGAVRLLKSKES